MEILMTHDTAAQTGTGLAIGNAVTRDGTAL